MDASELENVSWAYNISVEILNESQILTYMYLVLSAQILHRGDEKNHCNLVHINTFSLQSLPQRYPPKGITFPSRIP